MAGRGRPKSQNAAGSTDVSVENKVEKIIEENTIPGNEELLNMVAFLQKEIDNLKKVKSTTVKKSVVDTKINDQDYELDEDNEFDKIEIRPDTYVKVISLCPFQLNLTTRHGGKGKIFSFNSFGATKRIMYGDLVEILETHENFLKEGYFYVMSRAVIRKNGLDSIYDKLLSKEKIESILSGNNNDTTISLFKSANKSQQNIIIQMLIDKMISGQEVDLNLIDKLSRISGVNISEKYENTKIYVDSLNINQEK